MSEVKKFYAGKNVLITGATGFIGKVFVEKLIRVCDEVNCLYLLVRPKDGVNFEKRAQQFCSHVIFNTLHSTNPDFYKKIKIIEGDVERSELGLNNLDREDLINNVQVIIHNAANVKFDLTLKSAIRSNALGTLRMLELAKQTLNLEVFVYVSTAYSQAGLTSTDECYYPAPIDPYKALKIAANLDDETMNPFLLKFLGEHINTYTFSKGVSEELVYRFRKYFPIAVVRPSVVCGTLKEPVPGYVEGLTGFTGFGVACGRGVIRTLYLAENNKAMMIPADIVANTIIASGYLHSAKNANSQSEIVYYNCTIPKNITTDFRTFLEYLKMGQQRYPFNFSLWYPCGSFTFCWYLNFLRIVFFQIVPAILLDGVIILCRQKPILLRVQRKVKIMLDMMIPFVDYPFIFESKNFENLYKRLNSVDSSLFELNLFKINLKKLIVPQALGARRFILKEKDEDLGYARRLDFVLYFIHNAAKYYIYFKIGLYIWNHVFNSIYESIVAFFQ